MAFKAGSDSSLTFPWLQARLQDLQPTKHILLVLDFQHRACKFASIRCSNQRDATWLQFLKGKIRVCTTILQASEFMMLSQHKMDMSHILMACAP